MFTTLAFKKKLQCFLLIFLIGLSPLIFAQNTKPKVALVLSGGGAKGLAHIPTLQLLDSLGIVPDLIVGNSMGSVVGGLYAMGYSGDSIAQIAMNTNWDNIMGGGVSLRNVSVEEKSEFNRYLIGMDWSNGKVQTGSFLLNDQNLRELLSSLTYSTYNITNFDNLSIPFRAIATDIINGKEVILNEGSLAFAMRASMSIPSVFSAVPYEGTLLVDGGVLNNFPVDVAKKMGADIIIGSDVGGGTITKEKLNNITAVLFQASMLSSKLKNPMNRELCDILIDNKLSYVTGDFAKGKAIYEEGKIAAKENKEALANLAKMLKKYEQRTHKLPYVKDEFILDTIVYTGISKTNLALVKGRTNIKAHEKYTRQDIADGINRAMGTTIFSKITFNPIIDGDKLGLELNGFEKSRHQVKGSVHFDGYYGVGLILNYTGRNIIGQTSRSLITIDIAEQPRIRIQHQKNFSPDRDWWWRSEAFGQQLKQKVFVSGENVDNIRNRYFEFDNQINRNLSSFKSYLGIGVKYQNTYLKPTIDPDLNENVFGLKNYSFNTIDLYAEYVNNSLNEVFFATKGAFLQIGLSRSLYNKISLKYSDQTIPNINGSTNGYTKLGLNFEKRLPLQNKITGIFGTSAGFIFEDELQENDVSFSDFGVGAKYILGGNLQDPRKNNYIFPGLIEGELTVSQFIKLDIAAQFNSMNRVYITPHINLAYVGFNGFEDYIKDTFSAKGKWENSTEPSLLFSAGAMISYNSILGPVNLDVSWVDSTDKIRVFIGIGLHFNRSN
jgi:NTE family protein